MAFNEEAVTATILASGAFDAEWYLEAYPDVKILGMDPLEHYIRFGETMGRSPGPKIAKARGKLELASHKRTSAMAGEGRSGGRLWAVDVGFARKSPVDRTHIEGAPRSFQRRSGSCDGGNPKQRSLRCRLLSFT